MKFRLILFTLLICMISFAGIRAEIPDPEESLRVAPDIPSEEAVVSDAINLPFVICAVKSVCLCGDIAVTVQLSDLPDDYSYPVVSESFKLQDFFERQFSRRARDGLIQYII